MFSFMGRTVYPFAVRSIYMLLTANPPRKALKLISIGRTLTEGSGFYIVTR